MSATAVRVLKKQWTLITRNAADVYFPQGTRLYLSEADTEPVGAPQGNKAGTTPVVEIVADRDATYRFLGGSALWAYPSTNGGVVFVVTRKVGEIEPTRMIEYAHQAVHSDILVIATHYDADIDGPGESMVIYVKPTTGIEMHSVFTVEASGPALLSLYDNPVVTSPGTEVLHMRCNGWSTKDLVTTYHTPSVSDNGTLVWRQRIPGNTGSGGSGTGRIGGSTRTGEELIVPASQSRLVVVTPEAANTHVSFANEYYEVPDGTTDNED